MADQILTVQPPEGGTLWQMGGRKTTEHDNATGITHFTITGGRLARRLDEHQAVLICGECHAQADIERADGLALSDSDIMEALTVGVIHQCTSTQQERRA